MGVGTFKVVNSSVKRSRWEKKLVDERKGRLTLSRGGSGIEFEERYIIHLKNDKQEDRLKQIVTEVKSHFPFGHCSLLSTFLHPSDPIFHRV